MTAEPVPPRTYLLTIDGKQVHVIAPVDEETGEHANTVDEDIASLRDRWADRLISLERLHNDRHE